MQRYFHLVRACPAGWLSSLLLLALLLSACDFGTPNSSKVGSNNANSTNIATPTPIPAIQYGEQKCPAVVNPTTYWDPIVPTQPAVNKVESVTCAFLMGIPALQAVVAVRSQGTGALLDVYVYNKITDPHPQKILMLQALYKGDVKISGYNTLLTGEVDQDASVNKGQPNANLKMDLYREFKWADTAGTLVPVTFSGIYPALTRYEAEALQQEVNRGQQPLLSASQTAVNAVSSQQLLKWSTQSTATVVSGAGVHDTDAVVTVKNGNSANTIKVMLSRLEQNVNGGIWVVTGLATDGMSLTVPKTADVLTSPATIAGQGNANGDKVKIFDHLYNEIGTADATGNATFSASVNYNKTFKNGSESGLVALYGSANGDGSISSAVITRVLLG